MVKFGVTKAGILSIKMGRVARILEDEFFVVDRSDHEHREIVDECDNNRWINIDV